MRVARVHLTPNLPAVLKSKLHMWLQQMWQSKQTCSSGVASWDLN